MILGTCNFNQNYNGIEIKKSEVLKMIDCFYENGGRIIDSAINYKSHSIIREWLKQNKGNELKIITKIWQQDEFWRCFDELGVNEIYCVMARENNLDMIEFLRDQKVKMLIEKFGLSCYLPEEMTRSYFQCLEIPLDNCWLDRIDIISLYASVYIRSVYNHYIKNYGEKDVWEIVKELKKNKKVEFVVGCDTIEQLKENMKRF